MAPTLTTGAGRYPAIGGGGLPFLLGTQAQDDPTNTTGNMWDMASRAYPAGVTVVAFAGYAADFSGPSPSVTFHDGGLIADPTGTPLTVYGYTATPYPTGFAILNLGSGKTGVIRLNAGETWNYARTWYQFVQGANPIPVANNTDMHGGVSIECPAVGAIFANSHANGGGMTNSSWTNLSSVFTTQIYLTQYIWSVAVTETPGSLTRSTTFDGTVNYHVSYYIVLEQA